MIRIVTRVLLVLAVLFCMTKSKAQVNVLIVGADNVNYNINADVQTRLQATGQFTAVDVFDAAAGTPTLVQLQNYKAVLVHGWFAFSNTTSLGNVLASYVDGGGAVVTCMAANTNYSYPAGNFTGNYHVWAPGSYNATSGTQFLGTVFDPSHPIMNGVSAVTGVGMYRVIAPVPVSSAVVLANWNDGRTFVAYRTDAGSGSNRRRVDINMVAFTSAPFPYGWNPATNGGRLMANALSWAAQDIAITPGAAAFYQGNAYTVSFSSFNVTFASGNTMTAQLSNASGSFASPTNIGSITTTSSSGTISVTIPANALGTGYRMRIVSSNPAFTGSPNGANLTIAPPPNALNFDGTDDYISIGTPFAANGSYTKEAWVYPTIGTTARNIVSSEYNPFWFTAGKLSAGNNGNYSVVQEPGTTALNTWTHVAVTYDAPTTTMKLYKNGVLIATNAAAPVSIQEPAFIGSHYGGQSYFQGSIDEVRVWNRALCQGEIQYNMNGMLLNPASQTGLVRSYSANQGIAGGNNTATTSLTDGSGAAVNGVLTNFTLNGAASNFVASTVANSTAAIYQQPIAATNSTITQTIIGTTSYNNGCDAVAIVAPTGGQPVSGSVTTRIWIESGVPTFQGSPYLARHYEITPATDPTAATANVTLYFTQAEFTAYNAAANHGPNLPADAADAANNKANLRITKKSGSSSNVSGLPGTYNNIGTVIVPTSVTWNSTAAR